MRKAVLDTHVFLWWLSDDPRLGNAAKEAIADARNEIYVSAATTWEISIKRSLGKLVAPDNLDAAVEDEGFLRLPISLFHGERAGELPAHHRDPFDRMLIAQCQADGLELVTSDEVITRYAVRMIDASR